MRKLTNQEFKYTGQSLLHFMVDYEQLDNTDAGREREYTVYRTVERLVDGRLILTTDLSTGIVVARNHYEIDSEEFVELLDRAIRQGQVAQEDRKNLIKKAKAPLTSGKSMSKDRIIYNDSRYRLAMENGRRVLYIDGEKFEFGGHGYEPVIWFKGESGRGAVIHDCDGGDWEAFVKGQVVLPCIDREYDPIDLCRMFEYSLSASKNVEYYSIYTAEKMFGGKPKQKATVIKEDPFYKVAEEYDRGVFGYCIVKDNYQDEKDSHRRVLRAAARKVFGGRNGYDILDYDMTQAAAKKVTTAELFDPSAQARRMTFCDAFLHLPKSNGFSREDFARVCRALFPSGTSGLEIMEWTTSWAEYFYGDEPWKACCYTVYDRNLDRYAVIMASTPE